ncbi:MAG TPA: SprB repeat-containing protein, partial [Saprospiraceae bacterium]|nr:SprB repeat-containing protein [Saprospiraceae bacterium]
MKRFFLLLLAASSFCLSGALAQSFTVTIENADPPNCPGDCGLLLANPIPASVDYTYKWNVGAPTQEILYCQPGTYTVTVTNIQGQTATSSITVWVPQNGATGVSIKPACCFGSCTGVVDIGVGNGTWPLSYLWSNGSTTEDLTNACAGTYSVTVTDANGCIVYEGQHTISQPAPLTTTTQVTPVGTNGSPGAIDLTVSGGTPPYSVFWSNGNNTPDLPNINQPGTYCFTVSDSRGCTKTDCVTMPTTGGPNTMLAITADIVHTCGTGQGNCSGSISPSVSGGSGQYVFTWTGSNGYTSTVNKPTGLCVGTYLLTVTDVAIGITTTATYTIQPSGASDPLIIQSSNSAFCNVSAGTGGKCQQLCPNARVSYFINPTVVNCNSNQPPATKYVWTVNGAESWSVTPDTKRIDVVW